MKKIAVFFGGRSAEHDVSVASAANLLPRMRARGLYTYPVFIDKSGALYRVYDISLCTEQGVRERALSPISLRYSGASLTFEEEDAPTFTPDAVFSLLHGTYGEDGAWQGLLTLSGIPFIGCGVLASALTMHKALTKEIVDAKGIPTARWLSVRDTREQTLAAIEKLIPYPVFVKPATGGSSLGAGIASDRASLIRAIESALVYSDEVLVEEYIKGSELSVAVLEKDGVLTASDVGEVTVSDGFYDYNAKYQSSKASLICPAPLGERQAHFVREAATKLFRLFRLRHMARIDFLHSIDGRILFNEINTIPGFTSHSLYTRLLDASGCDVLSLFGEEAL